MRTDAVFRWAARVLTILAASLFLAWVVVLDPVFLLAAMVFGGAAYAFFSVDRGGNLPEIGGYGRDSDDRVGEGAGPVVSPAASAGGIHLYFMSRSRWRARR